MKNIVLICFVLISFALALDSQGLLQFDLNSFKAIRQGTATTCYGVIMDGGSSGTRVYVYSWPCRTASVTPMVNVTQDAPNQRQAPGISTFASNIAGIPAYLKPLIDFANRIVPESQKSLVPIYLRCTAGMRLLTQAQQDAILAEVRTVLRNSGYFFGNDNFAKVISGQEEGAFNWLATNFLNNLLKSTVPSANTMIGLDLGGASTQITFIPAAAPSSNGFNINLPSIGTYNTYSISFLYYGLDQALILAQQAAVADQANVVNKTFPCFPKGYTGAAAYNSSIILTGTSDPANCYKYIRQIFNMGNCGTSTTCTINNNYLAPIPSDMQISAVSGFATYAGFYSLPSVVSVAQFRSASEVYCNRNYSNILANYAFSNFLQTNCFGSLLATELLSTAYKLPDTRTINTATRVNGVSITWPLGSILYDISELPCVSRENCPAKPNTGSASQTQVLSLFAILAIMLLNLLL